MYLFYGYNFELGPPILLYHNDSFSRSLCLDQQSALVRIWLTSIDIAIRLTKRDSCDVTGFLWPADPFNTVIEANRLTKFCNSKCEAATRWISLWSPEAFPEQTRR